MSTTEHEADEIPFDTDDELSAIEELERALKPLTPDGRARALTWVHLSLGVMPSERLLSAALRRREREQST